ncbi:MAG TPA: ATP-dependent DNA helicase [Segeticoccus sp.]|uniref:ATP-dependent helicase n=1 Tax=Segeticoccus sp. TaxID=2706531 RepID=UPI002D7E2503|nr:ATP-dependent DNA helicase [Segeticoccus sp.]HET8599931.1 ATP-dependent DNA helicase [Segeticoccus sp.]
MPLLLAPEPAAAVPELDEHQRAAVGRRGRVLRVLGGPGTGKTTVAVETILGRVRELGLEPDQCLALAPSRQSAGRLREQVTARLGGTSTEPLARSHQAFAFGILRQDAALRGDPAPRLLSGPEQDVILRELLAGHARGLGRAPRWPASVVPALETRGFRAELRDLLMRAVERGIEPDQLADLGRLHDRPEWVAAAQLLQEYDEVTALARPSAYDPAAILTAAADLLEEDPAALDRVRSGLRLVVVDDAQELTAAAARLLDVVTGDGTELVLLGDPDVAVQGFRGADPGLFLSCGHPDRPGAATVTLQRSHRLPPAVARAAARVSRRIGAVAGSGHREPEPTPRSGAAVEVRLLRAAAQEAQLIASELRRAHLLEGVPWAEMAVIVRGQGRTGSLRRILAAAGVPVSVPATQTPLRDEVAVRPFLALLEVVLAVALGRADPLTPEVALDVLQSPIGHADAVAVRRLRRSLRRRELEDGGGRTSDELLVEALLHPEELLRLGPEAFPARRVATVIRAGVEAARAEGDSGERRWAPGVTAESVLWAMWQASGLAEPWKATALAGGVGGQRADRDLDAVLGLFDAAAKYVDRLPRMGPTGFLEHLRSQDVAEDSLLTRAPEDAVRLLTPQGAAGLEWELVVVAGVQEGVWPDLRLRGSLLGSERLVDVLTGRGESLRAAQTAVRYDETRQFLMAITRARRRLLVTAVRSDEEQPSPFLDVLDPPEGGDGADLGGELRPFADPGRTMTLASLVGELRRELVGNGDGAAESTGVADSARQLAHLASAGVPGADPADWWSLLTVSDDRPLRPDGVPVTVSPSRIEAFGDCGLRWLLSSCGGDGPSVGAASIGTLVHDLVAELGDVDAESLRAAVDERWSRLGLPEGWLSDKQRAQAHAMVDRFAAYVASGDAAPWRRVGAELDMEVTVGRARLRGRVDRLEQRDDGALRVVDLKTGTTKPVQADLEHHPQLGAYQLAVEEGAFAGVDSDRRAEASSEPVSRESASGESAHSESASGESASGESAHRETPDVSGGAVLLQLGKAAGKSYTLQQQPPLGEQDDPDWARELVVSTAEGMAAAVFTARQGTACRTCPVRASCPLQPEGDRL